MTTRTHEHGPIRYFHNETTREVWARPDSPMVIEDRENETKHRRRPKRKGWRAVLEVEHIRADNWSRPDNNQWHFPGKEYLKQHFESNYTLKEVRHYFNINHPEPGGLEIPREEYEQLKAKYEGIARRNPCPAPLRRGLYECHTREALGSRFFQRFYPTRQPVGFQVVALHHSGTAKNGILGGVGHVHPRYSACALRFSTP